MPHQPFPIIISAASGTGKTTLSHLLLESSNDIELSISYTTRAPRGDEQHGREYFFVSDDQFQKMIKNNSFLEWAQVHGEHYGTSLAATNKIFADNKNVVFDIDVQGALQIKQKLPEAILIFILPPTMDELKKRILRRGTESKSSIDKRMKNATKEIITGLKHFDFTITNETLDRALFDLTAIIRTHKLENINRDKLKEKLGL